MVNIDINKLTTRTGNINSGILTAIDKQDRFIVTEINIDDLIPSEDNFYSLSDIDGLKENIEEFGIQQNLTVMKRPDKKYEIIAGHRRREACRLLVQEGKKKFRWLPCRILPPVSETVKNILLITMNSETRKKTSAEITEEIERLKILYANYRKENPQFKGRVREIIAKDMGMSVATVGRHEEINKNLIPEIKDAYKADEVNFTTAVELSRLSAADQKAVYEKTGGKVTSQEIKKQQIKEKIEENMNLDGFQPMQPVIPAPEQPPVQFTELQDLLNSLIKIREQYDNLMDNPAGERALKAIETTNARLYDDIETLKAGVLGEPLFTKAGGGAI
ncbi:ParB N-terminal domain-containing protein [Sporomusa sphaeroides DSM 2875]|uniref:ParB/RepB/Spo0J family partition protein n=1 Tax=Sporomusa sphaeroides TaxID=47679 RepID=UPI00202E29FD|nr:ParB N-terminal domain-containing protein [Sporomusa sphaeroides DSM 2875]